MKAVAIIPCRYTSTRFEGKPLSLIGDKPMMWHVYQQAAKANSIEEVYIATDSEQIGAKCDELGMNWIMTADDHISGTDRVAECAAKLDADVIVNVQGDEPFILPESIDAVTEAMIHSTTPNLAATNGCGLIEDEEELKSSDVVKVVFSASGMVMSYSRLPIPLNFRNRTKHYRQLGLYAFRKEALLYFAKTEPGPLEKSESVEMFRFAEHDRPVLMVEVDECGIAVDTPEDLFYARQHYANLHR